VIDAFAAAPEASVPEGAGAGRVWRTVLVVMAFQALIAVIGMVVFSAMGFANDGVGTCGGG